MLRNVLRMESAAKNLTITEVAAFILLLDIATAFPAASRAAIFKVLEAIGAPTWWINAVKAVYDDNYYLILKNGEVASTKASGSSGA